MSRTRTPSSEPVSDAGIGFAKPLVLPICAITHDHVEGVDSGYEFCDLIEPELAVAIREKDKITARRRETAPQSSSVSAVVRVANLIASHVPRNRRQIVRL